LSGKPLDTLSAEEIIARMDKADARALEAVRNNCTVIADAARDAADAIRSGGRLIYVGAGTSGRLGVLDASECPPTFRAPKGQVVGLIAGGRKALTRAVEGAEDDADAGASDIDKLSVAGHDLVVGISASGGAPYVTGALDRAQELGASTWLITCSPTVKSPHRTIVADTGEEVIRGSSRLAAGTATKLILNRITTAAFVMLGKVHGDLMVDVMPSNNKLIRRAAGIIMELTGAGGDEAMRLLSESGASAKVAVAMKLLGVSRRKAERLLARHGGSLRTALAEGVG
jgi:N-acetylmuramic acid 6-phosphate etherase